MLMVAPPQFDQPLVVKTISANQNNYNQKSDHTQTFPSRARTVINASIYVGSSSTGTYGYTVGSGWPAGAIPEIVINGEIQGRGGNGGNGGNATLTHDPDSGFPSFSAGNGTNGSAGGPALDASGNKVRIYNNGAVRGGSGGGAGAGAGVGTGGVGGSVGGSAGGGGRGTPGGSAGTPGTGFTDQEAVDGGQLNHSDGAAGSAGSSTANGSGGASISRPSPPRAVGGAGGDGGDGPVSNHGGTAGRNGGSGDFDRGSLGAAGSGGTGGAAGACTLGNANITWVVTGTREGALN